MAGKRGHVEIGGKRVRVMFGGVVVADTTTPRLVWELPFCPTYYLPLADVDASRLVGTGRNRRSPQRGNGSLHTVRVGGREATDAALCLRESPVPELCDTVRFDWESMDAWFEEDQRVHVHPRDPYVRVDVLASSRLVRVEVDGVVVAESPRPHLLFETGLPTRYYLPPTDVRMDLLEPSATSTRCPYKGTAQYFSVRAGGALRPDLAWVYPAPFAESLPIAGLIAFRDERVAVHLDGRPVPPVRSRFA